MDGGFPFTTEPTQLKVLFFSRRPAQYDADRCVVGHDCAADSVTKAAGDDDRKISGPRSASPRYIAHSLATSGNKEDEKRDLL